jgi:hypothetical protein
MCVRAQRQKASGQRRAGETARRRFGRQAVQRQSLGSVWGAWLARVERLTLAWRKDEASGGREGRRDSCCCSPP